MSPARRSLGEGGDAERALRGSVVGVAAFVDHGGGEAEFGAPFEALVSMQVAAYATEACALCRQGIPVVKPGSRAPRT